MTSSDLVLRYLMTSNIARSLCDS